MKKWLAILIVAVVVAVLPGFLLWAHHTFITGLNPFLSYIFIFFLLLIALLFMVKGFGWVKRQWKGNAKYLPAILFLIASLTWGGYGAFMPNGGTSDFHFHDTYYVISHGYIMFGMAILLGLIAAIYFLFSGTFASGWLHTMSFVHFWVTFIGSYLIFWPDRHFVREDAPRRYMDYSRMIAVSSRGHLLSVVVLIVLIVQVVFVGMILYAVSKRFFKRG